MTCNTSNKNINVLGTSRPVSLDWLIHRLDSWKWVKHCALFAYPGLKNRGYNQSSVHTSKNIIVTCAASRQRNGSRWGTWCAAKRDCKNLVSCAGPLWGSMKWNSTQCIHITLNSHTTPKHGYFFLIFQGYAPANWSSG